MGWLLLVVFYLFFLCISGQGMTALIIFLVIILLGIVMHIDKSNEKARLKKECEEKEKGLLENYGKLSAHEILLDKTLDFSARWILLEKVHNYTPNEITALMNDAEKAETKAKLSKVRRGIYQKANELYDVVPSDERTPIPDDVQQFVWRRDKGCCVKCGSNEKLEFDHIIPFSKGGSNTERNLQLLCEACNREKSNKI